MLSHPQSQSQPQLLPASIAKELNLSRHSLIFAYQHSKKSRMKNYDLILMELLKLNITKCSTSLIASFRKDPTERNFEDIFNIKAFLDKSQLIKKFKEESLPQDSLNKLTLMCAIEMKYQLLQPKEVLFKIGDIGKDFYLVISGTIDLLKLEPKTEMMTGFQYFTSLMKLKKNNEHFIFNKIIDINQAQYPIEEKDKKTIHHIAFVILMNELLQSKITMTISELADLCCIDLSGIKRLNIAIVIDYKSLSEAFDIIKDALGIYEVRKINKYNYLQRTYDSKEVKVFEYQSFLQLGSGCYFGDSALDKQLTRNSTVQSIGLTEIAVLDGLVYNQTLKKEKVLLTNKEVHVLHKNFFFEGIPQKIFEKKHFNMFIAINLVKGEFICREDQTLNDLYFLTKGEIDLVTNKNIVEIQSLLSLLEERYKQIKNDDSYTSETNLLDLRKELLERKMRKVFIYGENEVVGLESFIYNSSYLVSAVVASDCATVFKVSKRSFVNMLTEFGLLKDTKAVAFDKMKILYSRLWEMNKTTIGIIDKKKTHSHQSLSPKTKEKNVIILSNENNENKTFIRINPTLFVNSLPKYKENDHFDCLANHLEKPVNLPKLTTTNQFPNQPPVLSYEDSLIRSIKQDIRNEKRKSKEMSTNFKNILPLQEYPNTHRPLRNCFSYNNISNPNLNKQRIEFLIREKEQETKAKEEGRIRHKLDWIQIVDGNSNANEELSSNSITIIASKKKPAANYLFYNPLFHEKKPKYSIMSQLQNDVLKQSKMEMKATRLVTRDSESLSSDPYPKGKLVYNCYQKKTLEYQTYKKKIENKFKKSLRYLCD